MEPPQGHALGGRNLTARHRRGDLQGHGPVRAAHATTDRLAVLEDEGSALAARISTLRRRLALDDRQVGVEDEGSRHEEPILGQVGTAERVHGAPVRDGRRPLERRIGRPGHVVEDRLLPGERRRILLLRRGGTAGQQAEDGRRAAAQTAQRRGTQEAGVGRIPAYRAAWQAAAV